MNALAVAPDTEFPIVQTRAADHARGFLAVIERGPAGWSAYLPDLPGVVAAGETEEEVRSLIAEAVEFHLEGLREARESVPEPVTRAVWIAG